MGAFSAARRINRICVVGRSPNLCPRTAASSAATPDVAARVGIIFAVAVIFGLVNAFVKPIVQFLSIPLYILTLGIFHIVVNALMLWITAGITAHTTHWGLQIDRFWWDAVWAAILLSIVSWILSLVVRDELRADSNSGHRPRGCRRIRLIPERYLVIAGRFLRGHPSLSGFVAHMLFKSVLGEPACCDLQTLTASLGTKMRPLCQGSTNECISNAHDEVAVDTAKDEGFVANGPFQRRVTQARDS